MAVGLIWNGTALLQYTDRQIAAGLKAAGLMLHTACRKAAGTPNPGQTRRRKRDTSKQGGGPKGSQYTVYPSPSRGSASPTGESPHRRSGFGQKNIVWGFNQNRMAARVGYTAKARYMTYHELGIRYPSGTQYRQTIVATLTKILTKLRDVFQRAATGVKA